MKNKEIVLMEEEQKLFHPFCFGNERVYGIYMLIVYTYLPQAASPGHQGENPEKLPLVNVI